MNGLSFRVAPKVPLHTLSEPKPNDTRTEWIIKVASKVQSRTQHKTKPDQIKKGQIISQKRIIIAVAHSK